MKLLGMCLSLGTVAVVGLLTGCGTGLSSSVPPEKMVAVTGSVHGGQAPVTGAHVFVFEQADTGYGMAAVDDIGPSHASQPGVAYDVTVGAYYVTTDSSGNFTITGDYTCQTANSYVYVVAPWG